MCKNSGYYVKTALGKTGFTIHKDQLVNGKIVVYLTKNFNPILDEKGDPSKILCNKSDLNIIGFKD